ncbi:MAG: SUMF1/EgtB/PvdO family nonheme iron enzyme [Bacteroidetes bacterium]|nr:SUMF1/EgtB/PvdO family nonheme iron enzyme [Bacteroidota bacterium]
METTENNFISDHQFDVLLRHALLGKEELFNEKNIEKMANSVFSQPAEEISVADNRAIIEKLVNDLRKGGNKWRMNIFILIAILLTATTIFFFFHHGNNAAISHNDSLNKGLILSSGAATDHQTPEPPITENPLPVTNPQILALFDSLEDSTDVPEQIPQHGEQHYVMNDSHMKEDYSLQYIDIPTLTEEQKIQTGKDKMKMMKNIARKKTYGNLPPGKTIVNGKMVNVDGFSIENSEVSNLEYRTFLNDLLVEGKDDEYLLAAPVKGQWKTAGIPEFEEVYFTSAKYNDFPAVSMTRKGAELYCEWLTESMKGAINSKQVKWSGDALPDFRLPSDAEWIYAARGCDSTAMKYPWGKFVPDSVQNKNGCFLCDFNYTSSKDYFAGKHICAGYQKLKQAGFNREIITTAGLAIDSLLTCPVYSYNPNSTGQYCMLGDVSEMVWTLEAGSDQHGAPRAMGGNWNSYVDNIRIEAPEQYVGFTDASPMIGFRPAMNGHYNYSMIKKVKL